jgi:hypothetical protein
MPSRGHSKPEAERMIYIMSDTKRNQKTARTENTADTARARLKEKLYKAKASGELTEDDEAEILRYAVGVVSRRGQKPRD